ncbi:NADH dehydrogenase [ubiquinone] 1 alpha subcomplex subunit 10, mitochondrial [Habropoda laboriosa]|uniref:NADH dehydrogenase [ubiquinone] 1 alpha subcomplex subunit 10, mitochondrial n=1 Tax=Habropoda laboriosa TaxID=597456 RepID=A0A0L7RAK7_9HYME|nr:PREDICTED: NADH dehydrogenase [ubiquinone] 1 alpha subcomplex subunit 10, mitochondrial [Habropoda laboriosa]KOC67947.1 NADH dehydrogenase [ubiquinone] 1 alpha subcomplex subunit 10, mitochondrial [Habropoda laboriosa]
MISMISVNILKSNGIGCLSRLCKISKSHNVTQVAFIKRLSLKVERAKPTKVYPYWRKGYTVRSLISDPLVYKYDESSKLIVVDGLPAIGKTKFCEKLAEEFGLLYMPPPTHDQIYINCYGYDFRELDSKLPSNAQSYDLKRFLKNPNHPQVPQFQLFYMLMRFEQYINAIIHILATGQGVILNRSIYSDVSFTDAMYNAGYLNKVVIQNFEIMKQHSLHNLLRPHLVIYFDALPDAVQKNIKKRGNMDEVNSKVFTTKYLSDMDKAYKEKSLTWLSKHTHILMYDWSTEGNYLDVFSDIENLDLQEDPEKNMLSDWIFENIDHVHSYMLKYQNKVNMLAHMMLPKPKMVFCEELWMNAYDNEKYSDLLDTIECEKYLPEYHPAYGDKVLFKSINSFKYSACRRTPRDLINYSEAKLPHY